MSIYKAYIKQKSDGCDYTIGCARTVINIDATSLDEAKNKLFERIKEDYSYQENRLKSVELFEISNIVSLDMNEIYKRIDDEEYNKQQQALEEKERADYERLKAKFGH